MLLSVAYSIPLVCAPAIQTFLRVSIFSREAYVSLERKCRRTASARNNTQHTVVTQQAPVQVAVSNTLCILEGIIIPQTNCPCSHADVDCNTTPVDGPLKRRRAANPNPGLTLTLVLTLTLAQTLTLTLTPTPTLTLTAKGKRRGGVVRRRGRPLAQLWPVRAARRSTSAG